MNKENQKNLKKCPPVVVVLGHVDHGKTTLLTAIKDFGVLEKEAGGITQHIGAYEIEHKNKKITFIDTPGHEAFEAMRSRGAKVADVAILVVDATQGVQAQTKEAIFYIKKRGLPLVVALNKMDLPQANPERVKDELAKLEIKVENRGGKIPALEISAKTGQGIEDLLEVIFLIAEIEEIKGDFSGKGQGVVIESYLNHKRGPTATLLVKNGILKKGDIVATNSVFGKVKILENFQGKPIEEAFPSMPVIVLGFEKVPQVGEEFKVFEDQEKAKEYIKESLIKKEKEIVIGPDQKVLNLIIKTDVAGSIEAVERVLENLPQDKIVLRIIKKEVGAITEKDVKLAKDTKSVIVGFRVGTEKTALELGERDKIKMKSFDVIYELSQGVRNLMEKMISPKIARKDMGKVKILVVFRKDKKGQIVGGKVIEGEIIKDNELEILREDAIIGKGKLKSLQKQKKDIERGVKGDEIGILYQGEGQIQEGDILIAFKEELVKPEL